MNKLLAISVALLSLNLYGADKPVYSYDGLEGWGKKDGVKIIVEPYLDQDKTYDKEAIRKLVERRLRLAGFKVIPTKGTGHDAIHIDLQPIGVAGRKVGYNLRISPVRKMTFMYNGKEHIAYSSGNRTYGGISPIKYREFIEKNIDMLLLDYLEANISIQLPRLTRPRPNIREAMLKKFDKNGDGKLDEDERPSREEMQEFFRSQLGGGQGGRPAKKKE